jgi:hypothetical protein
MTKKSRIKNRLNKIKTSPAGEMVRRAKNGVGDYLGLYSEDEKAARPESPESQRKAQQKSNFESAKSTLQQPPVKNALDNHIKNAIADAPESLGLGRAQHFAAGRTEHLATVTDISKGREIKKRREIEELGNND